jgi:hypothetical protein
VDVEGASAVRCGGRELARRRSEEECLVVEGERSCWSSDGRAVGELGVCSGSCGGLVG